MNRETVQEMESREKKARFLINEIEALTQSVDKLHNCKVDRVIIQSIESNFQTVVFSEEILKHLKSAYIGNALVEIRRLEKELEKL